MQIHPLLFLRTNWFSIANKCTLADSCHGGDLAVCLGSAFLCFGSVFLNKSKDNDNSTGDK